MKSMTPIIRPLRAGDLKELAPELRGSTVRGFVAELEGTPVGVMGVVNGKVPVAFSVLSKSLRRYRKFIIKALKIFSQLLQDHYTCVYAAASLEEESTFRTLSYLGFLPHTSESETHRGIWVWQRQQFPS